MNSTFMALLPNFLMGKTLIASFSYLSTFVWWSYPTSIIPSIYFLKIKGKTNEQISKFLLSATVALLLLALSTFIMSYYMKYEKKGILMPALKTSGWWVIGCILFYAIIMHGGYKNKFI